MGKTRKLQLTWDRSSKRWKRVYRGQQLYFSTCDSKTDTEGYREALRQWHAKKLEIDSTAQLSKPNAKQYQHAIGVREKLIRYFDQHGQHERAEGMQAEIAELTRRYEGHKRPPALELYDLSPLFDHTFLVEPLDDNPYWQQPENKKQAAETGYSIWQDRIKEAEEKTDTGNTIGDKIEQYTSDRRQAAQIGQISPGWFGQLDYRLRFFRRYCGATLLPEFNANIAAQFHRHICTELAEGKISNAYASGILVTAKQFIRWLWEHEYIESLPRNLRSLKITNGPTEIATYTTDEIKVFLANAKDKLKLCLLLMLNCGMTQQDVSDLHPSQVNWKEGRITRKRSKTKDKKNAPTVSYSLWPETLRLLKQFRTSDKDHVLLSENDSPLVVREIRPNGNIGKVDNLQKQFHKLLVNMKVKKANRRPLKLLRKTSATLLASHESYGQFAQYFLGHAPSTIAEKHYVRPSNEQFDKAIAWLGQQYGVIQ